MGPVLKTQILEGVGDVVRIFFTVLAVGMAMGISVIGFVFLARGLKI